MFFHALHALCLCGFKKTILTYEPANKVFVPLSLGVGNKVSPLCLCGKKESSRKSMSMLVFSAKKGSKQDVIILRKNGWRRNAFRS